MLQRNHVEPPVATLSGMREMADRAGGAGSLEELLGIEGNAARLYFGEFAGMIKVGEDAFERVAKFCFMGNKISADGGAESSSVMPPSPAVHGKKSANYIFTNIDSTFKFC